MMKHLTTPYAHQDFLSQTRLTQCLGIALLLMAAPTYANASATASASTSASIKASATTNTTKPALTVTITQAKQAQAEQKLTANGSVAAWQEAIVGSEAAGLRLDQVHVNVGDVVRKGQVLASFASESIQADVAQAKAALQEAKAVAEESILNADRARGLQSSGAMSKQQIGQYLTAEQTAKARVAAVQAALDVQILRLRYTKVLAPDDGTISARTANVGAVVGNGAELFRLIRQNRLEWRAELTSADLSKVKVGMDVLAQAPNGIQAKGKVRSIAPTVDAQTRSGLVYVDLQSEDKTKSILTNFKPGMFAKGSFSLGQSSAILLPQQAVVLRDGFSYVFRLNTDQRVSQLKVKTGRRVMTTEGEQVEILSGLASEKNKEAQPVQVVVSGAGFLNEGDLVKVVAPAAAVAPAAIPTSAPAKAVNK
jgi:RND family efflux transporter MFP subunit